MKVKNKLTRKILDILYSELEKIYKRDSGRVRMLPQNTIE